MLLNEVDEVIPISYKASFVTREAEKRTATTVQNQTTNRTLTSIILEIEDYAHEPIHCRHVTCEAAPQAIATKT
jgi:hypothetical protein